jgi:hypothetical protein
MRAAVCANESDNSQRHAGYESTSLLRPALTVTVWAAKGIVGHDIFVDIVRWLALTENRAMGARAASTMTSIFRMTLSHARDAQTDASGKPKRALSSPSWNSSRAKQN